MVEQEMRFSNKELELLKNTFAENNDILKSVRKIMLQLPIAEDKEIVLRNVMTTDVMAIIRKIFMPELDGDAPLHQVSSIWFKTANDIRNNQKDIEYEIDITRRLIEYIKQQLDVLKEGSEGKLKLESLEVFENKEDLLLWNDIIHFVEGQINQIKVLAGQKGETPEETIARLKKDSSK